MAWTAWAGWACSWLAICWPRGGAFEWHHERPRWYAPQNLRVGTVVDAEFRGTLAKPACDLGRPSGATGSNLAGPIVGNGEPGTRQGVVPPQRGRPVALGEVKLAAVDLQHGPKVAPQHVDDVQGVALVVDQRDVQLKWGHRSRSQKVDGLGFGCRLRAIEDIRQGSSQESTMVPRRGVELAAELLDRAQAPLDLVTSARTGGSRWCNNAVSATARATATTEVSGRYGSSAAVVQVT